MLVAKMKGFAGILLLFAIIIAAGILLTANMQTKQEYSFKELIPQEKSFVSEYEINLHQMAAGCNWDSGDIASCIDSNAILLDTNMNAKSRVKCAITKSSAKIDINRYSMAIRCGTSSTIAPNSITIDQNKQIFVTRN